MNESGIFPILLYQLIEIDLGRLAFYLLFSIFNPYLNQHDEKTYSTIIIPCPCFSGPGSKSQIAFRIFHWRQLSFSHIYADRGLFSESGQSLSACEITIHRKDRRGSESIHVDRFQSQKHQEFG